MPVVEHQAAVAGAAEAFGEGVETHLAHPAEAVRHHKHRPRGGSRVGDIQLRGAGAAPGGEGHVGSWRNPSLGRALGNLGSLPRGLQLRATLLRLSTAPHRAPGRLRHAPRGRRRGERLAQQCGQTLTRLGAVADLRPLVRRGHGEDGAVQPVFEVGEGAAALGVGKGRNPMSHHVCRPLGGAVRLRRMQLWPPLPSVALRGPDSPAKVRCNVFHVRAQPVEMQ